MSAILDWCEYGRPWRKRTRFMGTLRGLESLTRRWSGGHERVVLQESVRDESGRSVTRASFAAEYRTDFCSMYQTVAEGTVVGHAGGHLRLAARCERARSSTLLSGFLEKDCGLDRRSRSAAERIGTTALESRTPRSAGTPSGWHL